MIECTAFELVGEYSDMIDRTHAIRVGNGKATYFRADYMEKADKVRLQRLLIVGNKLQVTIRYVACEQKVFLISLADRNREGADAPGGE